METIIRVTVRLKTFRILDKPYSALRRLRSDCVNAQADLSLRWRTWSLVGNAVSRLIFARCRTPEAYTPNPLRYSIFKETRMGSMIPKICTFPTM